MKRMKQAAAVFLSAVMAFAVIPTEDLRADEAAESFVLWHGGG